MNKESFLGLMADTHALQSAPLAELEDLVKMFPYCPTSRILLTRKLKLEDHHGYDTELKKTALFVGDRRILRHHLESRPVPEDILTETVRADDVAETGAIETEPEVSVEPAAKEQTEEIDSRLTDETPADEPAGPDEIPETAETPGEKQREADAESDRIQHLKKIVEARLRKIEQERAEKPVPAKTPAPRSKKKRTDHSQTQIIDEFIKKQPSISRPQASFFNPEEAAKESVVDEENIVSETLAKIYFDQKHFEKAINIYRKLSLIYPEKSSYFAAQIEKAVEELKK